MRPAWCFKRSQLEQLTRSSQKNARMWRLVLLSVSWLARRHASLPASHSEAPGACTPPPPCPPHFKRCGLPRSAFKDNAFTVTNDIPADIVWAYEQPETTGGASANVGMVPIPLAQLDKAWMSEAAEKQRELFKHLKGPSTKTMEVSTLHCHRRPASQASRVSCLPRGRGTPNQVRAAPHVCCVLCTRCRGGVIWRRRRRARRQALITR